MISSRIKPLPKWHCRFAPRERDVVASPSLVCADTSCIHGNVLHIKMGSERALKMISAEIPLNSSSKTTCSGAVVHGCCLLTSRLRLNEGALTDRILYLTVYFCVASFRRLWLTAQACVDESRPSPRSISTLRALYQRFFPFALTWGRS